MSATAAGTARFREVVARDRERGLLRDPKLAEWRYVRRSRTPQDQALLFSYHGPQDLVHWVADQMKNLEDRAQAPRERAYWRRPSYVPAYDELLALSSAAHDELLAQAGDYDREVVHHRYQDIYNVQDFHYATAISSEIRTVLDFGAGYARQSFLFARALEDARYIATDAVEQSYLLQSWVLRQLGLLRWEYLDDGEQSTLGEALERGPGAFHVPSWRLDLVPDDSVDLFLFVWCLYELTSEAARAALAAVRRVVPVGGYVYIRDNPHHHGYRWDPEAVLRRAGFELALRPPKIHQDEFHGQIRLYQRVAERRRPRAVAAPRRFVGKLVRRAGRGLGRK